jgi:hypothetical protein
LRSANGPFLLSTSGSVLPSDEAQEYREFFESRGFKGDRSIDNFTIEMEESTHQAIHGGGNPWLGREWPAEWNRRIIDEVNAIEKELGRQLSFEETLSTGENLLREYGIQGDFVPFR